MKAYYTNKAIPETSAEDAISESDRKLLQKCIDIIRENFTNPDFDVASLANALCMGRSKLYTKFKQLVGLPPNEFILKIKLEEAMSLLKEHPELNISESYPCKWDSHLHVTSANYSKTSSESLRKVYAEKEKKQIPFKHIFFIT